MIKTKNETVFLFAINSLIYQIPKLIVVGLASEDSSNLRFFVSTDAQKKELCGDLFNIVTYTFSNFRKLIFFSLGVALFYRYFWVDIEDRQSAFRGFVLNRSPRRGSVRFLSLQDLIYLRAIFLIRFLISIGMHVWLQMQNCKKIIFEERTKTPELIVYHLCIKSNIECIQCATGAHKGSIIAKKLTYNNKNAHPMAVSRWHNNKKNFLSDYEKFYDKKRVNEFYTKMNHERYIKNSWYNREIIETNYNRIPTTISKDHAFDKTILLATHIFWDATFAYGRNVFEDYSEWFDECLEIAKIKHNHLFLIKLHPDLLWKADNLKSSFDHLSYVKSRIKGLKNCQIIDQNTATDNLELFQMVDLVMTVRGTLGLEAACNGTKVMTAGEGRYDGLGFTFDCRHKSEFLKTYDLALASEKPKDLDQLARFVFEYLFHKRHFHVPGLLDNLDRTKSIPADEVFRTLNKTIFFGSVAYNHLSKWVNSKETDLVQG